MNDRKVNIISPDLKTKRALKDTISGLKDTVLFEEKIKRIKESFSKVDSSKSSLKVSM